MQVVTTRLYFSMSQAFDKVWHASLLHKIKNCFSSDQYAIIKSYLLQRAFRVKWSRDHAIKGNQLWSPSRQRSETGVLSIILCRSFNCHGYHNHNLCGWHSYFGSQQPYRSISAFIRKPLLHPEMVKGMENQNQ